MGFILSSRARRALRSAAVAMATLLVAGAALAQPRQAPVPAATPVRKFECAFGGGIKFQVEARDEAAARGLCKEKAPGLKVPPNAVPGLKVTEALPAIQTG